MKTVSVIVSAYNSHDTLARCLGCLVHQTLKDIEIIVVNDASQDDTWEIMQRCKQQYPDKIQIINGTENRGRGGAKNQGIDIAEGEYIGFVDSDDYVAYNMFELLYLEAKEKTLILWTVEYILNLTTMLFWLLVITLQELLMMINEKYSFLAVDILQQKFSKENFFLILL